MHLSESVRSLRASGEDRKHPLAARILLKPEAPLGAKSAWSGWHEGELTGHEAAVCLESSHLLHVSCNTISEHRAEYLRNNAGG